jgi:hypothetical protein
MPVGLQLQLTCLIETCVNTTTRGVHLCANGQSVRASSKNEAVLREWLANTPVPVAAGDGRRALTLLIRPGPALDAEALTGKARRSVAVPTRPGIPSGGLKASRLHGAGKGGTSRGSKSWQQSSVSRSRRFVTTLALRHRFSRCHKGRRSRWSRGYISTSPFHPAKIPSRRREDPWPRSCIAAWQPTQMSPHQNDHCCLYASISRDIVQPKSLAPDSSASRTRTLVQSNLSDLLGPPCRPVAATAKDAR